MRSLDKAMNNPFIQACLKYSKKQTSRKLGSNPLIQINDNANCYLENRNRITFKSFREDYRKTIDMF